MNRGLLDQGELSPDTAHVPAGDVQIDVDEQALWEEMEESEDEGPAPPTRRPDAVKFIRNNLSKFSRRNVNPLPAALSPEMSVDTPRGDVEMYGMGSVMGNDNMYSMEGEDENSDLGIVSKEKNLDAFFSDVYYFFYEKGLVTIIAKNVMNVITLGFMIIFSTFLMAFLDWSKLLTCKSRETCQNFHHYVHFSISKDDIIWRWCVAGYVLLSCFYWIWNVCSAISLIFRGMRMSTFFDKQLQISTKELQTMEWDAVVSKMIPVVSAMMRDKHASKQLSAHVIASRIMRKDNYMIAFINRGLLNISVPCSCITHKMLISKYLEYYLQVLLINSMFTDDTFKIRDDFKNNPGALKTRFFWTGILLIFVSPFILLFMIMDFFMRNAQEWHSKQNYLGPRRYSAYAQWTFREFNELPHVLERRLAQSYQYGHQYLQQFQTHVIAIIARGVMFISGALVAVMLLFTILDESILLYVHIFSDHDSIIFYISIFSAIFGVSRAVVPSPEDVTGDPERIMQKCAAYTHHMPIGWRSKCNTYEVHAQFQTLFQYKAEILLQEILAVLCAPWILIVSLPSCADDIVRFVTDYTDDVKGVGAVCCYSQFDFKRYGDPRYGCRPGEDPNSRARHYNRHIGFSADGTDRLAPWSRDGKMEKSFVNFKENHPEWTGGGAEGEWLLASINSQTAARQQQHIQTLQDSMTGSIIGTAMQTQMQAGVGVGGMGSSSSSSSSSSSIHIHNGSAATSGMHSSSAGGYSIGLEDSVIAGVIAGMSQSMLQSSMMDFFLENAGSAAAAAAAAVSGGGGGGGEPAGVGGAGDSTCSEVDDELRTPASSAGSIGHPNGHRPILDSAPSMHDAL